MTGFSSVGNNTVHTKRVRWRRILWVSTIPIGVSLSMTFLLRAASCSLIDHWAVGGSDLYRLQLSHARAMTSLLPAINLLLVLSCAAWMARFAQDAPVRQGALVGIACALGELMFIILLGQKAAASTVSPFQAIYYADNLWPLARLAFEFPAGALGLSSAGWNYILLLLAVIVAGYGGGTLTSATLQGVRWRRIVMTGALSVLLSLFCVLVMRSISISIVPYLVDDKQVYTNLQSLHATIISWLSVAFNLLLVTGLSIWMTRRIGTVPILQGALIGTTAALLSVAGLLILGPASSTAIVHDLSDPWQVVRVPFEIPPGDYELPDIIRTSLVPLLMIGAGILGGRQAREALTGQKALSQVSQAIRVAHTPDDIVTAIGHHLAIAGVWQVLLWQITALNDDETPAQVSLWAFQAPQDTDNVLKPSADLISHLFLPYAGGQEPLSVQQRGAPPSDRAIWQALGARSALLLPLTTTAGEWIGLLMLTSRDKRGFKQSLWRTPLIDTQVALSLENMALLSQARQMAVLGERQRLAREIHDTIAQSISSIVMHLEAADQSLPEEPAVVQRHLDQARQTARESLSQARRLVWALRPEPLEQASLPTALERVSAQWAQENDLEVTVAVTGTARPLPADVEVTLLRAAQEALTNVRKHAQATQVAVTLSYMSDIIVLDVQDNGRGFHLASVKTQPDGQDAGGFGLLAMRERVEQLGGSLFIESAPGQGTTLVVEILLARQQAKALPVLGEVGEV